MLKISFYLVFSRKKWLLLFLVVFSLIISSIIAIFSSTESIKAHMLKQSFQQYGGFTGVLLNIKDDNNLNEILPDSGKFKVLKEIAISNHLIATLGWADNNFIELGELKLKTGRFPVENNEVAVESYYLDSLDSNWKINESKTFIIDENIEVSLTLVGVVENYSSRWTTVGINYPNMFLSKINFLDENDGNTNFLLEYDTNNSIKTNEINARNYIRENNENGFLNDRLIHHGLKDYEKIMVLSYILQFIILIVSLLCILTIFAYYNSNQVAKYSVFRALGCTTRHLHIIQCLQITIIFILGSLCSIPLILFFRYMIVRTSYGIIEANFLDGLYYINLLWFVILFAIILTLSYLKLRKVNHKGINRNLQVESRDIELLARVNHNKFNIKQLMMQILLYPKQSLLSIFTICFTILLLLFSNTIANELKGGWTTKIDFYLTSQELIGTKLVSGRSVVVTKGLTFSPSDVSKIEQLSGIKHFEKEPFMVDVRAIMKRSDMSKSLLDSRKGHRVEEYLASNDKLIIPDVRYVLMKEDEIRKEYSIGMEENLDSSIIIYIPGISAKERERMLGKNIALSKAVLKDNTLESKEWDFKIIDILDRNYLENGNANKNEITLIMSEDSVFTSGISTGYINLTIYTNENLSVEEKNEIYNSVYLLTAGIPGSLFQYIPDLIHDNTRISDFLSFSGRFAFYISIIISICSMYVIIFGKYQLQKRNWGIYRSLGMNTNQVFFYLLLEALFYFSFAVLISSSIYLTYLYNSVLSYPFMDYIFLLLYTSILILLFLLIGAIFLKKRIKKDSISTLLKIED